MAEHDLKTFHEIGRVELIKYYELYPTLSQTPDMPPSNRHPQTQLPHTSGNQGQYSSTNTPLQSHSVVPSDAPPQQGLGRTLEGPYNKPGRLSGVHIQPLKRVVSNPPSRASEWNCPHCTFKNSSRNRVCQACDRKQDFKVDQSSAQGMPPQTQQKICPSCYRMNRMQAAVCAHCNASFM